MSAVLVVLLIGLVLALAAALVALFEARRSLEAARQRSAHLSDTLEEFRNATLHVEALWVMSEVSFNPLLLVDEDHGVINMNRAARDLFHHTAAPGPHLPPGTVMSVTRSHEIDDAVNTTLESGEPYNGQVTVLGRPYLVRTLHLETLEGDFVALAMEDVGELERLGRARRDMVANISHELRTPITSIRLLADTLERELERAGQDTRLVEKIIIETETLQQMAGELLDLAMIESGRAEFIFRPVPLRPIIDEAVEHFSEQIQRGSLHISLEMPYDLRALVDPDQIKRVLNNLLHNAIKFTPAGGLITISAEQIDPETVQIVVMDTGPGVPPEDLERIFERFYRGDRARQRGGTGLGLAVVKHIIAAHGGRVWAENRPTGSGARLVFTVRAAED